MSIFADDFTVVYNYAILISDSQSQQRTLKGKTMNISHIVMRPEIWMLLFVVTGPGIELIPCVRAFRAEQDKFPRFADVPSVGASSWWISLGWLGPFASMFMTCTSIVYGIKHDSARNLIVTLILIPIMILAVILIQNHAQNYEKKKINIHKIIWRNASFLQFASVLTTVLCYILFIGVKGNLQERLDYVYITLKISLLALFAIQMLFTVLSIIRGDFTEGDKDSDEKIEEKASKDSFTKLLLCTLAFNPISSLVTIPGFILFGIILRIGCKLNLKWATWIHKKLT